MHFDMKYLLILFRILHVVDAGVPRKAETSTFHFFVCDR